jgi:putative salt-induced outer membrane protein YdiY
MGFFTKKTKEEKAIKKERLVSFLGESVQAIGKIPAGSCVGLSLKPDQEQLNIHNDKIDITLPYERIVSFRLEDETTIAKSGSGLGGAIVGGVLFGGAGAIVGQNMKKGNTKTKWIATLTYKDKEGNVQQLNFIQRTLMGYYEGDKKSFDVEQFENTVNNIISRYSDDISEL